MSSVYLAFQQSAVLANIHRYCPQRSPSRWSCLPSRQPIPRRKRQPCRCSPLAVSSGASSTASPAVSNESSARIAREVPAAANDDNCTKVVSILGKSFRLQRRVMLYCVPALCSTFVVCAKALFLVPRAISPGAFNALRLLIAAAIQLPVLMVCLKLPQKRAFLTAGAELGLLNFLTNFLQIVGLKFTQASRAAFVNQTQVVLVPVIAAVAGLEALSTQIVLSAVLALLGVSILTLGGGLSTLSSSFIGDILELLSAVFSSVYILRVGHHVRNLSTNIAGFMAAKASVQAFLSVLWVLSAQIRKVVLSCRQSAVPSSTVVASVAMGTTSLAAWTPRLVAINAAVVLWCGIMVAWFAAWLHYHGQTAVSASETTIIFSTQPVWASLLATVLLSETFGPVTMLGGALIIVGSVLSSWKKEAT